MQTVLSWRAAAAVALLGVALCSSAQAALIATDSMIWMLQYEGNASGAFSVTSSATQYASSYASAEGNDIRARGNLASGEVGTQVASAPGSSGQAMVVLFDTLTFNTPGGLGSTIHYSMSFDGSLTKASPFSNPYAQYRVSVYDITGLGAWIQSGSLGGLFDTFGVVDGATKVADTNLFLRTNSSTPLGTLSFDEAANGSFVAEAGHLYGITVASNSFASQGSSSDFLNTGSLAFTDLGGASFSSGSGVFLSARGHAVDEPAMPALLLAAAAAAALRRRRGRVHP